MHLQSGNNSTIHPFFWLVIPILLIVGQIGIELFVPQQYMVPIHSEGGIHETLQSIVLMFALIIGLAALVRIDWGKQKLLGLWFLLACACCVYVSGEEISWGQHVLNWNTPSYWAQFNDQNETNLHNTSAWLDQKPRLILFIGIAFGGLVIPALRRWKPSKLPARFAVLYPSDTLAVTAMGVTFPYLVQEIVEAFGVNVFERVSEVQELYMYYFVMLYLWDLRAREIVKKQL